MNILLENSIIQIKSYIYYCFTFLLFLIIWFGLFFLLASKNKLTLLYNK